MRTAVSMACAVLDVTSFVRDLDRIVMRFWVPKKVLSRGYDVIVFALYGGIWRQ